MQKISLHILVAGFTVLSAPTVYAQFNKPLPSANFNVRQAASKATNYRREADRLNATCNETQRLANQYQQDARRFAVSAQRTPKVRARYKHLESQSFQLAQRHQRLLILCRQQQVRLRQAATQITQKPNLVPATDRNIGNTQRHFQEQLRQALQQRNAFTQFSRSTLGQIQREGTRGFHIPSSPTPPSRQPSPTPGTPPRSAGFGQPSSPSTGLRAVKLESFSISRLDINASSSYQSRLGGLIRSQESALRRCYNNEIGSLKAPSSAQFAFAFQLRPDGRATSSRIVRWPSESFRAAVCMRDIINNTSFPLPPNSAVVVNMEIFVRTSN